MALKLKIKPSITYSGVLDFDGDDYIYNAGADPSVYEILQGNKIVEFKLWLDTSIFSPTSTFGQGLIDFAVQNASDYLGVTGYNSTIRLYCNSNASGTFAENCAFFDIDDAYTNKILQFEIGKMVGPISGDGSILYVKINGENQSLYKPSGGLGRGTSKAIIGDFSEQLQNGTIWDVKITDTSSGVLEHYWKGYPNGNTNTAWEDSGNGDKAFNLILPGGTHTTRDITGYSGGGSASLTKRLKINQSAVYDVLNFDNSTYVPVYTDRSSDIEGSKKITFKLWLDASGGYAERTKVMGFATNNQDRLEVSMTGNQINVAPYGIAGSQYPIGDWYNKVLNCEVNKTTNSIDSFYINGQEQTPGSPITFNSFNSTWIIGGSGANLKNATVWDIKIYDTSTGLPGTLTHYWKGYPNGDTSIAWKDLAGSFSPASIIGAEAGTREIQGIYSGDISGLTRKLLLYGTYVEQPFFTFITDSSSPTVFDPYVWSDGGSIIWDLGDGSIISGDIVPDHYYSQLGDKTVKWFNGTTTGQDSITRVFLDTSGIKGSLDFSNFDILTHTSVYDNPDLTELIIPTSGAWIYLNADDCDLTGELDLSNMGQNPISQLAAGITMRRNYNLTSIKFPAMEASIGTLWIDQNGLTGTLDISGLTNWTGGVFQCYQQNITKILMPPSVTQNMQFRAYSNDLQGELDLSDVTGLYLVCDMSNNPNLTSVKFPVTNNRIIDLDCHSTGLIGVVDISGLTDLDGQVDFTFDSSLTGILLPPTSGTISVFSFSNCDLTGVIDISALTFNGQVIFNNNSNLTGIICPSSGTFSWFQATDCSLNGNLDISGMTLTTNLNINGNSNLTSITWPSAIYGQMNNFIIRDCSVNQTTVDGMFSILNDWFTSNAPTTTCTFQADGGGNAVPTDGSSNADILNLQSIFSGAGQILYININT